MAFKITGECISCGVCEPVCPNRGIREDADRSIYVIDGDACSECVGFFNHQRCAAVCPVNSCILDRNNTQTEAVLFERARALHAASGKQLTLTPATSHFRKPAPPSLWSRLSRLFKSDAPAQDATQRDPSALEAAQP